MKVSRIASFIIGATCAATLFAASAAPQGTAKSSETEPLPIKLPKAVFAGTPKDLPAGTNMEPPSKTARPIPQAPKGCENLALHKKVTSSSAPFSGTLDLITDGDKEAREGRTVTLAPKVQWVQIDLGAAHPLYYILFWHYHGDPIVCHDVVVQVSNDADFLDGVTTLFNNDVDNSAGLGIGKDREYWETYEGKLVDAKGVKARYIRLYSRGSTYIDKLNRYTEVEAWGLPNK